MKKRKIKKTKEYLLKQSLFTDNDYNDFKPFKWTLYRFRVNRSLVRHFVEEYKRISEIRKRQRDNYICPDTFMKKI